jgi:SRSO17 transposase
MGVAQAVPMTSKGLAAVSRRRDEFLGDLPAPMGRRERQHWARIYLQGLLLDGERKSIEPLAHRIAGADLQSLRQFVGQSPWAVEEAQPLLAEKMVGLLTEPEVWMIAETSFPKAGDASVGVARQYCGALGKVAHCQVAVSLHWSPAQMSCPLLWRLYLPADWLTDPPRRVAGKIPENIQYQSKNELALGLIDQALGWDLPRLPVVADPAYGNDFDFRQALRQRGLPCAVAVEPTTKVWTADPNQIPVPAGKPGGRPRKLVPLEALPEPQTLAELARALPPCAWQTVTWRAGTKGPQCSRFAKVKVWAAHGWKAQRHPERVAEWLLVEWAEGAPAPSGPLARRLGAPTGRTATPGAQGAVARAGGIGRPGTQGGTGVGSLRGASLAGLAPSCDAGVAGICVPASGTGAH